MDDVTCYVDVVDYYYTYNVYQKAVVNEGTTSHGFYSTSDMNAGNGSSVIDAVTTGGPELGDGTTTYHHQLTISYSYNTDEYYQSGTPEYVGETHKTRTAKGSGTGHTDVPVVLDIKLNVTKMSMWVLTNDQSDTKTVIIK